MRRIDADELIAKIDETVKISMFHIKGETLKGAALLVFENFQALVNAAPTIDAEPVRHGEWIDCDYKKLEHGFVETYPNAGKCCSNCRTGFKKEIIEGYIFCPNCGAKMDGGESV